MAQLLGSLWARSFLRLRPSRKKVSALLDLGLVFAAATQRIPVRVSRDEGQTVGTSFTCVLVGTTIVQILSLFD